MMSRELIILTVYYQFAKYATFYWRYRQYCFWILMLENIKEYINYQETVGSFRIKCKLIFQAGTLAETIKIDNCSVTKTI